MRNGMPLNQLQAELLRERTKAERRAVVVKYARKRKTGTVVTCTATAQEREQGFGDMAWGTNGKIIFDSVEIADQVVRELEALGSVKLRVYECHRSRHGHAHLTSKKR